MSVLHTIRNYICYCGIEKDEYNAIKKEAYISNFKVWRILHVFMAVVFGLLAIQSLFDDFLVANRLFYFSSFVYSAASTCLFFFVFKKESIVAQLWIYLTFSVLFLFGALVSQNMPRFPSTTFIALLLITPMFMIDKPYFMAIELSAASAIFVVWMYFVKPYDVWVYDYSNVILFTIVGIFLHVISNSIRIREFVLTGKINIQKDTDEMTGLKNKGSLTREINSYLADESNDKGLFFIMDVDHFKSINDTYGHDVGDSVITQFGTYLGGRFTENDIVGRFGGDEFIVFVKDTDDVDTARKIANDIVAGASDAVAMPDPDTKISVSVGIAVYTGDEKDYSAIFKKADLALYESKDDPENRYSVYDGG